MFETSYLPPLKATGKDPAHNEKMLKERLKWRPLGIQASKRTEKQLQHSTKLQNLLWDQQSCFKWKPHASNSSAIRLM